MNFPSNPIWRFATRAVSSLSRRTKREHANGRCRPTALRLEALESRLVPSASYAITDLGKMLGATFSEAFAINASGVVVGTWEKPGSGDLHAFIFANGRVTDLGSFGEVGALATGINDANTVAGSLESGASLVTFLDKAGTMSQIAGITVSEGHVSINDLNEVLGYSTATDDATIAVGGKIVDLGSLAGHGSVGMGLNNSGAVVGYSNTGATVTSTGTVPFGPAASAPLAVAHAFLFQNGKMTGVVTLGGTDAVATALNSAGVMVGYSQTKGDLATDVFSYANGKIHDLGAPKGSNDAWATAINASDVVVGDFRVSPTSTTQHAFIYVNGTMTDLNALIPKNSGYTLIDATAINNNGQIVANAINRSGQEEAVLLTPAATTPKTATGSQPTPKAHPHPHPHRQPHPHPRARPGPHRHRR